MSLPESDLMTLSDLRGQFFCSAGPTKRRVRRREYVGQQLESYVRQRQLESVECVRQRLQQVASNERQVPLVRAAIKTATEDHLPLVFFERFHKPTVENLNKELELSEEIILRKKESTRAELKLLKTESEALSAASRWTLCKRVADLVARVLQRQPPSDEPVQPRPPPLLVLSPDRSDVAVQIPSSSTPIEDFKFGLESVENFLVEMQRLHLREQLRRRNAAELKEKLDAQRTAFVTIKAQTAALERSLLNELGACVEQQSRRSKTDRVAPEPRKEMEADAAKLASVAALDALFETLLLRNWQRHSTRPTEMATILERRTQSLIDDVARLRRGVTKETQSSLEKRYVQMEISKLRNFEKAKAFQKRSEKLLRKMQIALMPPSVRTVKPAPMRRKRTKRVEEVVPKHANQEELEQLTCFDPEVPLTLIVRLYKPAKASASDESTDDGLQIQWQAGTTASNNQQ